MRRIWYSLVLAAISVVPSSSFAQGFDTEQLLLIRETAADICNSVTSTSGGTTRIEAEGNVSAELKGIFRRLADAGVDTAARITTDQYDNISREAVAAAIESDARCRERVFSMMFSELTKLEQESSLGQPTLVSWRDVSPVRVGENEGVEQCPCLAFFETPTTEYSKLPARSLVVRNDCSGNALIWGRRDQGSLMTNPDFQTGVPRGLTPDRNAGGTVTYSHQHEFREYLYENLRPGEVVYFDITVPDTPFARFFVRPIRC